MVTGGTSIRVLHVDDQPEFPELAARFLEREDERFEIETATSADECLDRLDGTDVDCIVSDYDMPETDGIELLEAVRADHPDLPFILFTGKGSEEVASEAITAGVTDYLQKGGGTSQYTVLANRIRNAVEKHRAQQELADSERRLALFVEQSPLGVIEWDQEFSLRRMNEAGEEILGYGSEELAGRSWEVLVPDEDRSDVEAVVADLLAAEGGYHSVNRNVRKDGESIVCAWHNRVVTDDDGDVVAVFSQFRDITDRERQAQRLETLIDNVPGMVYRCRNERGWPIESVRGEVRELTGYDPEEIEARTGIYGNQIIHPADREGVWEAVQTAVDAGDSFEVTYRITTKDGTRKWVWERGRVVESGDPELLDGFVTDISDHELARRRLADERTFVNQALDSLDDVFYVVDEEGQLVRWNARLREITGSSDAEIEAMDVGEFVPPDERRAFKTKIQEAMDSGRVIFDSALLGADGERIPYEFTGRRMGDTDESVVGLVGIGRDISERAVEEAGERDDVSSDGPA